ncbi:Tubulin-folding cofactor E [Cocos nucifera]|nr:Tubulin-folding cofactor E [Cocos nucifera]
MTRAAMDESSEKLPASDPNGNDGASPEAAEDAGFWVGQRVHAMGNPRRTGTVRYVGAVEGHAGAWVGVDWDDGEGKHDGSVNGVRYFAAAGERSASFVRPKNLSAGISFIEALHLRYRGDSTKEEEDLEEIDLTGNLLSKWQDIGSLCDALPALGVLNLTNNFMEHDVEELPLLKQIHTLVLNNCGMTWKEVEMLKESLTAVEELHLMGNKLRTIMYDGFGFPIIRFKGSCTDYEYRKMYYLPGYMQKRLTRVIFIMQPAPSVPVTAFVQGFDNLRLLNFEDNCVDSWDEILKFSYLRSLEQLHLNKNKLKHIYYPANHPSPGTLNDYHMQDTTCRPFEKLQCLLLGHNEIKDLASIDSLNSFPRLMDIRLSENPIVDPAQGGVPRFVLVARLAKAKILNGSEVSPRERKESEIRYVRLVMAKMQSDDSEEVKQLHPRFAELKALHGIEDEKPTCGISGLQKMASGLLCVTLKCVGASIGEKQPLTKKIPPTTTVGKLKVLCESFFKLKGIELRLFLQEEGLQFRCTIVA